MLQHTDKEKRENLDKAMIYLCKDEQQIINPISDKKERSVVRGTMPKPKSRAGRPRKK
jgi:hypothetical protein